MSNLSKQSQGFVGTLTMTSIELLELVNEARKQHGESEVRRNDFLARCKDELEGEYYETFVVRNQRGPSSEALRLSKDQCALIGMRESKAVRRTVLTKLKELEQGAQTKLPSNYIEALEAHLQSEREKLVIAHERDEAVRTKAQIGSRREATAMATASAAKREAQMLLHELGRNQHHATVRAVERATGEKFARNAYVELRRWCKKHNVVAQDVPDERHGSVKAWPAGAWLEAFDISLSALFGIDRSGGGNTGSLSHG